MPQIAFYDALLEACLTDGCPLCQVERAADVRYLDRLFYERVNEYNLRVHLRASLGFCPEHADIALREARGNALGLAIIYEDLLRIEQEQLEKKRLSFLPEKNCPACDNRAENNNLALAELSKNLNTDILQSALRGSQGLCLSHLRQALAQIKDGTKRTILLNLQQEIWVRLRQELAEYIRKNDYRFAGEEAGPEKDSWIRAVRLGRR